MNLADYLPEQYRSSGELKALTLSMDDSVRELWTAREDFTMQLDLSTATWGLALWERAVGLETELSRPPEWRRTRVLAKLRGQGTTTVAMLRNVAESFSNGKVDVIEHPDENRFDIQFTGTIGIPPNMDDLTAAVDEIKPAHLTYAYIYLYCTWALMAKKQWGEVKGLTWAALRNGDGLRLGGTR